MQSRTSHLSSQSISSKIWWISLAGGYLLRDPVRLCDHEGTAHLSVALLVNEAFLILFPDDKADSIGSAVVTVLPTMADRNRGIDRVGTGGE
jgi:hypothetical protein